MPVPQGLVLKEFLEEFTAALSHSAQKLLQYPVVLDSRVVRLGICYWIVMASSALTLSEIVKVSTPA